MDKNENLALIKQSMDNLTVEPKVLERFAEVTEVPVLVTTATELTVSDYESISVILEQKLGKKVSLQKAVEPAVIGGIIVQIGDEVFDASVKRQLEKVSGVMGKVEVGNQSLNKPSGIADALTKSVEDYEVNIDLEEVGVVEKVGDGIATVEGMGGAMAGEIGRAHV